MLSKTILIFLLFLTHPSLLVDSPNLSIQLIQKHGMSNDTAELLAKTYGGRAWEVCEMSDPTNRTWPRYVSSEGGDIS